MDDKIEVEIEYKVKRIVIDENGMLAELRPRLSELWRDELTLRMPDSAQVDVGEIITVKVYWPH